MLLFLLLIQKKKSTFEDSAALLGIKIGTVKPR